MDRGKHESMPGPSNRKQLLAGKGDHIWGKNREFSSGRCSFGWPVRRPSTNIRQVPGCEPGTQAEARLEMDPGATACRRHEAGSEESRGVSLGREERGLDREPRAATQRMEETQHRRPRAQTPSLHLPSGQGTHV